MATATKARKANTNGSKPKATPKQAEKVRPVEALQTPDKTQKSVSTVLVLDKLPIGGGGVRFKPESGEGQGSYIDQADWARMGKPEKVRRLFSAA